MKLAAKQLRVSNPTEKDRASIKRRDIYIILDNVLDTYNIGSIFRLADAVAVKCVYLCGQSERPPNSRIAKASVGMDKWVEWCYFDTVEEAVVDIRMRHSGAESDSAIESRSYRSLHSLQDDKRRGIRIIAIEQSKKAVDFRKADYKEPVAFVVGNETDGISQDALKLADQIVEIPMFGVNKSLNVMVSLAIVLFRAV